MHATKKPLVVHVTTIPMSLRYLLLNQLLSLKKDGYSVRTISSPGEDAAYIQRHGIQHHPVLMTRKITPVTDLLSLWKLYRLMRKEGFEIIHTHNPKPGLLGQLAAKMAGVPIIVNTVHGYYFTNHTHPLKRFLFIQLEKLAAKCSDLIWSQNKEDIQTAIETGICSEDKIKYLGNGIDISRFNRDNVSQEVLLVKQAELGLSSNKAIVGFVGRLVTEKGVHELMQAAHIVLQQYPNTQFLIVGPTDSDKNDAITPAIVDDYKIADSCIFTGMRQDMPEMYALMDVFVLPSHREGLPRSPMEASAMNVPCVVTDIRGCREVVEHNQNGLLVPLSDVQALADAIIELLTNKEKARGMGQVGRQMAEEQFDEQLVFAKVKAEYENLLRKSLSKSIKKM